MSVHLPLRLSAAGLALALGLAACRPAPAHRASAAVAATGGARTFQVKGVLKRAEADGQTLVIRHEAIPGYMAAMTMPFTVKDTNALPRLKPGDRLAFRLTVTDADGWIDQVSMLEEEQPDPKPVIESIRPARVVDELKVGDAMPDYRFTNELRQATTLSQFRGQALGFSFIYTRCPYPTFCPRTSSHFAEALEQLRTVPNGPTNWHFLSISFDPGWDTPSVLRGYARRYNYDARRWNFLTGPILDIDAITEQFGMFFARDGEGFSHNVRTVVLDTTGRIQRIFIGNRWQVSELVEEMINAAKTGR